MRLFILITLLLVQPLAQAGEMDSGPYPSREQFLADSFQQKVPKPSVLWVTKALQARIKPLLEHPIKRLRLRYWKSGQDSAWILEEIGKERPITAGFHVRDGQIQDIQILAFRESRGWEIRLPFFTRQFHNVGLTSENKLDKHIDSITGATLSVRAINKLARVALLLHGHVSK